MDALDEDAGASLSSFIKLAIIVITIIYSVFNKTPQSRMYKYWTFWIVWILFDFYVLGLRGVGMSNVFHALFPPCCFIFFYKFFSKNEISKYHIVGFVLLWIETVLQAYRSSFSMNQLTLGSDAIISNLIFWSLCFTPFLLLLKNNPLKITLLVLSVVLSFISGKRSAAICSGLIIVLSIWPLLKKRTAGMKISIVTLLVAVLSFFYNKFSFYFDYISNRLNDGDIDGNGRLLIYEKVLHKIGNEDILSLVFGNGYNSIYSSINTNAHNDALQMLFDYGLVGLISYIFFVYLTCRIVVKSRSFSTDFYPSLLSALVIILVLGAVSNLYVFNSYFAFICSLFGIYEGSLIYKNNVHFNHYSRL